MDLWNWGSPVAWAVFLVGCGITALLLALSFKFFSHGVEKFVKLPVVPKKR